MLQSASHSYASSSIRSDFDSLSKRFHAFKRIESATGSTGATGAEEVKEEVKEDPEAAKIKADLQVAKEKLRVAKVAVGQHTESSSEAQEDKVVAKKEVTDQISDLKQTLGKTSKIVAENGTGVIDRLEAAAAAAAQASKLRKAKQAVRVYFCPLHV
jgi:hypothetical protein